MKSWLEGSLLFTGLDILRPNCSYGLALGNLGNRNIPPGFVAGNSLIVCRLDHNHRGLYAITGFDQSFAKLFAGLCPNGVRPQTFCVGHKINSDGVPFQLSVAAVAVFRTHPPIPAGTAETSDARKSVVIEQNDVELVILL